VGKPTKTKWTKDDGKPTFTQVEQAIIESENLTFTEKCFYMGLKSFRNRKSKQCFPSISTLCERLGICSDAAYKYRKKLQALGIIEVTTYRGRKKSCRYRFILEDGNSQEISMVLDTLSENKIADNIGKENSRLKRQSNSRLKRNKIADETDTNHKKVTKRKEQQQQEPKTEPINPPNEPQKKDAAAAAFSFSSLPTEQKQLIRIWKKICHLTESLDELTDTLTDNMGEGVPDEVDNWIKFIDAKVDEIKNNGNGGFKTNESAYRGSMLKKYLAGEITADEVQEYNENADAEIMQWARHESEVILNDPDAKPLKEFPDVVGGVQ